MIPDETTRRQTYPLFRWRDIEGRMDYAGERGNVVATVRPVGGGYRYANRHRTGLSATLAQAMRDAEGHTSETQLRALLARRPHPVLLSLIDKLLDADPETVLACSDLLT